MNDIPRLSAKEAMILKMLISSKKALYGLEMVKISEGKLKIGTIYVTLSRMEEKGYLNSQKENKELGLRGLPRRVYKPTGLGERAFNFLEISLTRWNEVNI